MSGLTRRERDRLSDLLLKWTCVEESLLEGDDRDAIGRLRYLLDEEEDAAGTTYEHRPVVGAGYGPDIDPTEDIFTGQEFPLVAGRRHPTDQRITPTADDGPSRTV